MILKHIVENSNKTINEIIKEEFHLSNRLFVKLLNTHRIYLNNIKIDTRKTAKIGDEITIDLEYDEDNSNIIPKKMNLDILYEDEGLLILNKPVGIAVHPSILHYEDSLANGIKYYFDSIGLHKKIRPVNRLDLNTSGIIVFAKNEYIQECLIRQMENGTFRKEYMALAEGHFENKHGIIDAPIARKGNSIIERCISEDGQKALTEYTVLNEYIQESNTYSLVKCHLLTGRTHQIRVHLAYIGHPLVGDTLYGKPSPLFQGQALHSSNVSFIHPISKEPISIYSDIKIWTDTFFK